MRAFNAPSIPCPTVPIEIERRIAQLTELDLEIGAGQGLHAIRYCQHNPTRTLLAIERTHTKFARLESRRQKHAELQNLLPLHADAVAIVAHYLRDQQLARVFLLYPNPSPKAKHANLRWHNSPFMGYLSGKMRQGAELHIATNLKWYALEAQAQMINQWNFQLTSTQELFGTEAATQARTHFEKKYLERGETCYDLVFKKE